MARQTKALRHDPAVERVELGLLADDANDAVRALRGPNPAGLLSIIAFPLGGLVAEESFAYFDVRNRAKRIGSLNGKLLNDFRHSLKKVRARLKLFDDKDTGQEALVSLMATVRAKSRVLFAHPNGGLLQIISGPFRPDLGAFFVGDELVGTSHTALPAMGVTPDLLALARPGAFEDFSKFAYDFGEALGAHLANLSRVLGSQGLRVELRPSQIGEPVPVTFNDFIGDKFYGQAERAMRDVPAECVAGLILCAAQANACLYVFPRLLGSESNLLFRVQFLTAYHGTSALRRWLTSLPPWIPQNGGTGFELPELRHLFAHYELRDAYRFAIGANQPLLAAAAGVSGVDPETLRGAVVERLQRISGFLASALTKSSLRPIRAVLGSHS